MASLIALGIATLFPIAFLYGIYLLNKYSWEMIQLVLFCLAWGGAAYLLAAPINDAIVNSNLLSEDLLRRFGAPVIEEILKALFLFYLVRRADFKYFVDGAIFGFACGIGFAVFENYEYVLGSPGIAVALALSRVLSTNLIHATASALIGISLGYGRLQRSWGQAGLIAGGLLLAMALHATFNNIVSAGTELILAFVLSFVGIGFIVFMIYRGLAEERQWIEEKLGMADGVTKGEAGIVNQASALKEILGLIESHFGKREAEQARDFLSIQASLGVLRKTMEKLPDEKLRASTAARMQELRVQMDRLRNSVGPWCMLYVRTLIPPEGLIYNILEERIGTTDKSKAGTGLWKTLDNRVKSGDN
jgi:RsiW-degrading membrane proteinase PrsW (M82 family)